jgi:hypothetical protein
MAIVRSRKVTVTSDIKLIMFVIPVSNENIAWLGGLGWLAKWFAKP